MSKPISPAMRQRLVENRILAMTTGADAAVKMLTEIRTLAREPEDLVGLGLLESEIYALDLKVEDARATFEKHVDPRLSDLDGAAAAVVADNKTLILMDLFDPKAVGEFYQLVDVRRILGIELRDHSAILEAHGDVAEGKHYQALPIYWQQLRAAYRLQNWRARRLAEKDFAQELMRLGWLDESAYHAMLAQSKEAVESVGLALTNARSAELITKALDKLLAASALRGHATEIARMICGIADAVPDERLAAITAFLLRHAAYETSTWYGARLVEQIWHATELLAHRFDSATASSFVAKALANPILQNGGPLRSHLIKAMNALTASVPADSLAFIADESLHLIGDRRSDIDYRESLDLLCHVAKRADDKLKSRLLGKVFPSGASFSDPLLMQVGPHLGWRPQRPESLSNGAKQTAAAIRKQVERLSPNVEPAKIGGYGTMVTTSPEGRLVVHVQGATHWIDALVPYRELIEDPALTELLEAMLEMIAEPENLIANRAALVSLVGSFADRIGPELEGRISCVLMPIASGDITEPSSGQTHATATNPLNPIQISGGDPADLRGAALLSLADFDRRRPNVSGGLHSGILLAGITSPNPAVRRYALFAADKSGVLTSMEQTAVALAGLDPDARVARLAMRALVKSQPAAGFDELTWHVVTRCVEAAVLSTDTGYRLQSAKLLKRINGSPADLKARLDSAERALCHDTSYAVRQAMAESAPVPRDPLARHPEIADVVIAPDAFDPADEQDWPSECR